jgi:hypothetical protein
MLLHVVGSVALTDVAASVLHRTLLATPSAAVPVTKIRAPRALAVSPTSFTALLGSVAMDTALKPSLSMGALQARMKAKGSSIDVAI